MIGISTRTGPLCVQNGMHMADTNTKSLIFPLFLFRHAMNLSHLPEAGHIAFLVTLKY